MKKKKIKDIPYLPRTADTPVCVEAAVFDDMLIVDIHHGADIIRIALTNNDWINYETRTGRWSTKRVLDQYSDCQLFTERGDSISYPGEEVIKSYLRIDKDKYDYRYPGYGCLVDIYEKQCGILRERSNRTADKKKIEMEQNLSLTEGYSEGFEEWAKRMLNNEYPTHLYYKNTGRNTEVHCGKCGQVFYGKTYTQGIEEDLLYIPKPRYGEVGRCRKCGAIGRYWQYGKAKNWGYEEINVYDAIPMPDGVCIKYVNVTRYFKKDGPETVEIEEKVRNFFSGTKSSKAFHRFDYGRNYWTYRNDYGKYAISQQTNAYMYPDAWKMIEDKYPYMRYDLISKDVEFIDYLAKYIKYPKLEMLLKAGAVNIVKKICWGWNMHINFKAKKFTDIFNIREDRKQYFMENINDLQVLKALQFEKNSSKLSDEILKELIEMYSNRLDKLIVINKYVNINKAINYIRKQQSYEYDYGKIGMYKDYLQMMEQLGYDLTDEIKLFPRNLKEQHDKLVFEINREKRDKRIQECLKKYPDIRRRYKRLEKRYTYVKDGYLIRPAKDAGEIILEGATLHHCVGGDSYLDKHDKGESYILFMRKVENPEQPYITIEICKNKILQWYGYNDKKSDKEIVQPVLDDYIEKLNKRRKTA